MGFGEALAREHLAELLANPGKTGGKKNVPAFKPRQQPFAQRLNAFLNKTTWAMTSNPIACMSQTIERKRGCR